MKVPGPDHPIAIEPAEKRVQVSYADHIVADSRRALILKEADFPPVVYFPREDTDLAHLTQTTQTMHCPYKGDATFFTIKIHTGISENAAWSYEKPFPAVERIAGYVAFYPDRVDDITVFED